ncbi:aldehyde dehydrogenase X, mitochondrial precursor [Pyricularia oryzae Y34]|uniref:aldehyde dehydrogenase (NAD(+)) n=2 Tax=Pyricularia oryzae TaxID=318829 RepID=A0AA97PA72_PYRO3|nr:aldehyde dehydrogenase X, mitochondrial precursor [Pyricularia oryzae Y34]
MTANVATKLPEIKHTKMLINGKFVNASDSKTFEVVNPNTKQKVADLPGATEDDATAAVAAAKAAFPEWSNLGPEVRGSYQPGTVSYLRNLGLMFRTYIGHLHPQPPGNSSLNTPGFVGMTMRQPYGVETIIIPLPGALIAGNTVVLKSSEKAPLGVARVAELIHQAGFPPGVLNVISGHGTPSGSVLAHHMEVRIISYTGSTATGKLIQQAAAKSNLKMVNLEQGKKTGKLALGGGHIEGTDGFFVQPTVFLDQPEDARVIKEEIVGPVVCINTFETEHEAVPKGQRYRVWPLRPRLHARNLQGHARRQGARERIRRSKL